MSVGTQSFRAGMARSLAPILGGTLVALLAVLAAAIVAGLGLRLPAAHLQALVRYLLITAGISVAATTVAAWLIGAEGVGKLHLKIGVVCAIGPLLAIVNVYYTANSMLIKADDLGLLILLLILSAVVGIAFAANLARMLTLRIDLLATAAQRVGGGDLLVRVPAEAQDELGSLGRVLNAMAEQLQAAATRQHELEESRRSLLAAISHDLRTPLTTIRAVVEALDEGVVEDRETTARYLASARRHVYHLESLIDDLFELARLDAGTLELRRLPARLDDVIAEAIEGMQMQADERSIRLQAQLDQALPLLTMDRRRIGRVLLNLLGNALRHTPEGGSVAIRAEQDGAAVRVSVRDSGEGIAPDDLHRIFERFYRGEKSRSREHGGAGLGLAIARGLVEAHGGRIWAESTAGAGAIIRFTLPLASEHRQH